MKDAASLERMSLEQDQRISEVVALFAIWGLSQLVFIATTGTPPRIYINLVLLGLMIVGLALSLRRRAEQPLQQ